MFKITAILGLSLLIVSGCDKRTMAMPLTAKEMARQNIHCFYAPDLHIRLALAVPPGQPSPTELHSPGMAVVPISDREVEKVDYTGDRPIQLNEIPCVLKN